HEQHRQRVGIENTRGDEREKRQRIPTQRGKKARMKKFHRAPRRAAGHAGLPGQLVKNTTRPWQTEPHPKRRAASRSQRNKKPDQLVINLAMREMMAANLHCDTECGMK